ncbi:polysaccharide biosynthesis/export family protein [Microvirga sp. TS319]|uniref:polysaccharide biosynthesis/export family protein n=1 Tax=Microvirga sp. TS319 TaxID=3241165 RepID=UPI00351A34BA
MAMLLMFFPPSRKIIAFPTFLVSLAVSVLGYTPSARADYKLGTGDVIELSIAGASELTARVSVDLDGSVNVPIIGNFPARGLSLDVLRANLQSEFMKRQIPIRAPDGRTSLTSVAPEDVAVRIAEYRPVYLHGDIARAGEVPYRPGMSIRQAIAHAGGFDVARLRMSNPYVDTVEYQAQGTTLAQELAVEIERIKQLQAQLQRPSGAEAEASTQPMGSASNEANILAERLRMQQQDFTKQLHYILASAAFASSRAAVLTEQKSKEEEGSKADIEDFERSRSLFEKGTVSTQRVSDARRAMLLSSTRALQTAVEATRAQRESEEATRSSQQLQDQNRIRLLTELQDAMSRRTRITAQLSAAQQKLAIAGAMKSVWTQGPDAIVITLYRRDESGVENKIDANESMGLLPGDVVEVAIKVPAL